MYKKSGQSLRLSWSQFGLKSTALLIKKHFKLRKTRGGIVKLFELDLQIMTNDGKSIIEFQLDGSDYIHMLGMWGRIAVHMNDVDFMVWVAKSHNHRDELVELIGKLKDIKKSKINKVYLMTTKQAIEGFELDEIEE